MLFSMIHTGFLPNLLPVWDDELAELVIGEPEAKRHHLIMKERSHKEP